MKTKHLTIMFTDIKGFTVRTSSSTRKDFEELLKVHDDLIRPIFSQFGGTVIKTIGDAFLVTFENSTDAVLCGMEIQRILKDYNKDKDDNKIQVRVAINTGEAYVKDGDVYGEAVNIAARIEGLAEANEVYFTEAVYLSMNKAEIPSSEIGYKHLKGIPHEIKVYKVLREGEEQPSKSKKRKAQVATPITNPDQGFKLNPMIIGGVLAVIVIVLLALFVLPGLGENNQTVKLDNDLMSLAREALDSRDPNLAKDVLIKLEEKNIDPKKLEHEQIMDLAEIADIAGRHQFADKLRRYVEENEPRFEDPEENFYEEPRDERFEKPRDEFRDEPRNEPEHFNEDPMANFDFELMDKAIRTQDQELARKVLKQIKDPNRLDGGILIPLAELAIISKDYMLAVDYLEIALDKVPEQDRQIIREFAQRIIDERGKFERVVDLINRI